MYSKIAVFSKAGTPMEIREERVPELKPGEILVKNLYATLCRSDLSTYSGKRIEKSPTILGHEIVGRIATICPAEPGLPMKDEKGEELKEGEAITWAIYSADPNDPMSKRGIPQKARSLFKYGHELLTPTSTLHGGLAEYTIIRRNTPVMVLHHTPLDIAAIINCAVATSMGAVRLAGDIKGLDVIIYGAGMLGVIACALCHAHGANRVIAVDVNEERLKVASRFGATDSYTLPQLTDAGIHADFTFDFSGAKPCMVSGIDVLNIGGTTVWVGGVCPQGDISINPERIIRNLYTIKGLHNYNATDFMHAVNFLEEHHAAYPFEELIQGNFTLDEADKAFAYAFEKNPYRVRLKL